MKICDVCEEIFNDDLKQKEICVYLKGALKIIYSKCKDIFFFNKYQIKKLKTKLRATGEGNAFNFILSLQLNRK